MKLRQSVSSLRCIQVLRELKASEGRSWKLEEMSNKATKNLFDLFVASPNTHHAPVCYTVTLML